METEPFSESPAISHWKCFPCPRPSEHGPYMAPPFLSANGQLPRVECAQALDVFITPGRTDLDPSDKGLRKNGFCCLKANANSHHRILSLSPLYISTTQPLYATCLFNFCYQLLWCLKNHLFQLASL